VTEFPAVPVSSCLKLNVRIPPASDVDTTVKSVASIAVCRLLQNVASDIPSICT